ncbi:MAG: DNA ligase [Gemmatimonadetes bacterium]|nr:DNA ligase [Gemmatimonadota bacterium]
MAGYRLHESCRHGRCRVSDPLEEYRRKRDFRKTNEPRGDRSDDGRRWVIQKHAASSLHYDFRLEVKGVLKSWAVPKGPSTDPGERRLAQPTEDHPIEYGDFEGVIPAGEYGAGAVIVWDRGRYRNLTTDDDGEEIPIEAALEGGHASFWLEGEKISGGYALTRIGSGGDERWLLVKMDDEEADARRRPTSTQPESVKSGRTIEEVAEEE